MFSNIIYMSSQDQVLDNIESITSTETHSSTETNKINLTVSLKPTIFNNLKLNECPNVIKIKKLISSNFINDDEKKQLKKILKKVKNNILEVEYKNKKGFGRVYNPYSSSSLSKKIRHTIYDTYVDIDIVNCSFSILVSVCGKNNIKCKYLKQYVDDRENKINELSFHYNTKKEYIKELFIILLNSGSFKNWALQHNIISDETEFIKKIRKEIKKITENIINNNPKLLKLAEKEDKQNLKGSVVSNFIHIYESQILETVYLYCIKNGYIINNECSLAFDGFLIKNNNFKDELLKELEEEVKIKLGLSIKYKQKQMNEGFIFTDEELKEFEQKDDSDKIGVYNDLEAAQTVFKLYPNWVCCNSVLYVFDDKAGLWTDKEELTFKIISRFDNYLHLLTVDNKENIKINKKGYGNSTILQRQMIPQLKSLCINNNWMEQTAKTSLGKLLYNNGIYDMTTGIFNNVFDPEIVFYYKIYRNYETHKRDDEYIKDVLKRFVYIPLGEEVGNYFLLNIARGVAGALMKRLIFRIGTTDTGKSTRKAFF